LTSGKWFKKRSAVVFICGLILFFPSCRFLNTVSTHSYTPRPDSQQPKESLPSEPKKDEILAATSPKLPEGPIQITIEDAILVALENNRSLVVERLNPSIVRTFEDQEQAVFDPVFDTEISAQRLEVERLARSGSGTEASTTDIYEGRASLEKFFSSGTTVEIEGSGVKTDSSLYSNTLTLSRLGLTVTQALLRGYGTEVNLARLRQAQLETRISEYELRGFSEALVADVETTYWDFALAQRQIQIVEESLKVAEQQLRETEEMIHVGKLAEAEVAAVQAEVAAQRQALINARSDLESTRLRLLRLLNPPGADLWRRDVTLLHEPIFPEVKLDDVELHVNVAKRMRPELNQARLDILQENLELVRTKNGLLPVMDLFIRLGKTGYADSFGSSISDIPGGDTYDALAGVSFQYPFRNRDAKARYERSLLRRDQAESGLSNLSQLVELDVRTAYIEVNRAKEQISASSATRVLEEEKLRIETEKFRVGKSTSFLVAQAQRDLLLSRIVEVQAVANYLKALVELFRLDGSLLVRRGIQAPGREPVELPSESKH
jgi:outer membrane protein TolC